MARVARNNAVIRRDARSLQLAQIPFETRNLLDVLHERVTKQKLESVEHVAKQRFIAEEVIKQSSSIREPNFSRVSDGDLHRMAQLYDREFFGGSLFPLAQPFGLRFRWAPRMTSTGGTTTRTITRERLTGKSVVRFEIALSSTLLFQTFRDVQRPIRVSGMLCNNRLEAMQRVMEHELTHLIEMMLWFDSCCSAGRFQTITHRLFGHTEHRHELITQQERAASQFNVRVGSRVHFVVDGIPYNGIVNRITRRATVLVENIAGQRYSDGKHYLKFYVPVNQLSVQ